MPARKKSETNEEKRLAFQSLAKNIEKIEVGAYAQEMFLPYAYSVVLGRALTLTDGMKPVQRRILQAMLDLKVTSTANRQKVTKLVGHTLGAYHPHGDQAVEDALTRLAQADTVRVPLVDGKGNFGGTSPLDPPAAGRYIEARLTTPAMLLLDDLSEDAVPMVPNYDDSTTEASVLPVKWPVALINGASGIAVGYASNIPSHNPGEIMKAAEALTLNPDLTVKELMKIVPGPDFNMGGIIPSNTGIQEYMETGKGSFKIRGKFTMTPSSKGRFTLDFFELPYGIWPEKVIEELQKGQDQGRFKEVHSYKNLSDFDNKTKLVIETKPGANVQGIINELFTRTSLETSFAANLTTIVNSRPQLTGMLELLQEFIDFRRSCITRRLAYRTKKKEERLHLLAGILAVLLDLDECIRIIRNSADVETAQNRLMRKFKIDEVQANYILSMQLRRLTKQDSAAIKKEANELKAEIKEIADILANKVKFNSFMVEEFRETAKTLAKFNLQTNVHSTARRTEIKNKTEEELKFEVKQMSQAARAMEKNSRVWLVRLSDGRLLKTSKAILPDKAEDLFEDEVGSDVPVTISSHGLILEQIKFMSQDTAVVVSSSGMAYKVPLSHLPAEIPSTFEEIGIPMKSGETIVSAIRETITAKDYALVLGTEKGMVKVSALAFPNKDEFLLMNIAEDDRIIASQLIMNKIEGSTGVFISSGNNILHFDMSKIRTVGNGAGGVAGMALADEEKAIHFSWQPNPNKAVIISQSNTAVKATRLKDIPVKNRGGKGMALHAFRKGETHLVAAHAGENTVTLSNGEVLPVEITPRAKSGESFSGTLEFGESFTRAK